MLKQVLQQVLPEIQANAAAKSKQSHRQCLKALVETSPSIVTYVLAGAGDK